jgi:hypothetical protein
MVNRNRLRWPEATSPRGPSACRSHGPKGQGDLHRPGEVAHPAQGGTSWACPGAVATHRPRMVARLSMAHRWPPHDQVYAMSMREPRGWRLATRER